MAMKKYWFILLAGVVFPLFAGENLRVPDIRRFTIRLYSNFPHKVWSGWNISTGMP